MFRKLLAVVVIVMTSSLVLESNTAQAQGRHYDHQRSSSYGPSSHYYSHSGNRSSLYRSQTYTPNTGNSSGYGNFGGYSYPSQYGYSSRFGNLGGGLFRNDYSSYGYPTRGGLSIRFGTGGFGNRGYRGFGY